MSSKTSSRAVSIALVSVAAALAFAEQASATTLSFGAGSPASLDIPIGAGESLHVAVRPHSVDITLELTSAEGTTLRSVDDRPANEGLEELWIVADEATTYRLLVASRWREAGSATVEMLARRPATPDDRARARAEHARHQGVLERRRADGDLEAGLALLHEARIAFEALDLLDRAAAAATQEAITLERLDRGAEAVAILESVLAQVRASGDRETEANLLAGLANRAYYRGDLNSALDRAEDAEVAAEASGDRLAIAKVQLNLGLFRSFAGEHRAAADHLVRAAELSDELDYLNGEATAWFNASLAHRGLRDYGALFEDLRRADPLLEKLGLPIDRVRMRMNEGIAYLDLGDPERAAERFRQALDVAPSTEIVERARAELNLGQVALELGRLDEARERTESALEAIRGRAVPKMEGSALGLLSRIDAAEGRFADAVEHARGSVDVARGSGISRILPDALLSLAEALRRSGEPEAAEEILNETLAIGARQEDPRLEVSVRLGLARLFRDAGELERALEEAEAGIAAAERVRALAPTLVLQATLLARFRDLFDLAIEVHARLQAGSGAHARAAFELAERARARSLLDSLPALTWRDDETSRRLRDLGATVVSARERLAELQADGTGRIALDEAARSLDLALADYRTARAEWVAENPRESSRLERRPATLEQTQAALGSTEQVLLYHVGRESAFLFVVSRSGLDLVPLGPTAELEAEVDAVLSRLVRPTVRGAAVYRDAALALRRRILPEETAEALPGRLLVSPDGALVGLPFEALVLSERGMRFSDLDYLGARVEVAYLPSAAVGLELRERGGGDRAARSVAAFASPVPLPVDPPPSPLQGAVREVERLAESRHDARRWVGEAALEARVHELVARPPRALHLATHARIDERRPELSAVLLAPGDGEDGLLEGWEIASLPLPVELVVLSACESGLGRKVPGEGLIGLVQAFFDSGARSVVASLWPVADGGTSELMVDFYRELERAGPAVAMARARRAQIARGGLSAHPFYWAPFVVLGWDGRGSTDSG